MHFSAGSEELAVCPNSDALQLVLQMLGLLPACPLNRHSNAASWQQVGQPPASAPCPAAAGWRHHSRHHWPMRFSVPSAAATLSSVCCACCRACCICCRCRCRSARMAAPVACRGRAVWERNRAGQFAPHALLAPAPGCLVSGIWGCPGSAVCCSCCWRPDWQTRCPSLHSCATVARHAATPAPQQLSSSRKQQRPFIESAAPT